MRLDRHNSMMSLSPTTVAERVRRRRLAQSRRDGEERGHPLGFPARNGRSPRASPKTAAVARAGCPSGAYLRLVPPSIQPTTRGSTTADAEECAF
jgi:hypothetical protein